MDLSLGVIQMARHLLPFLRSAVCVTRAWLRGVCPREIEMNANSDDVLLPTSYCDAQDKLLAGYQTAMELWATCRDNAWRMGLRGRELSGELFRLQTEFANAYAALHKHRRECPRCSFIRTNACQEVQSATSCHTQPE